MVTVPSFLLRRLYVKGSLRNTDQGVQFQLMNKLGSGYARKLLPLKVDGQEIPLQRCSFSVDGNRVPFDSVSDETPFALELNKITVLTITGMSLSAKAHKVNISFQVPGLGTLQFDFTDVPSNG